MRTVGKGFGKALAILLSVALLCMFGMASAQEDWQLLNLILTWTDEAGTEFQAAAAPVALDSGEQVFWATVPNDSSTYMLSVSHPDHADYTFESSIGNVVAVNAGQEMNREQAVFLTAYDANGNAVDTYTLYISTYAAPQPEAAPLTQDVTARWMLTDGTVLYEQTVTLTEGVPQTFQRLDLDGYEPEANTPESITVTLAGDGSINPGMPVFYYHVKVVAPLTQDVTVRWMLTDGTVLTEQTVTLTEGVPQTFQRLALDGYEPEGNTPESITVTLAGDGSVNPATPVFYYHVKEVAPLTQDVTVRWMLTDGTVLTEQTVTLTEGVPQTFQRLALDGYEPEGNTPESITVTLAGDGSVNPATPVFYYHVKEVAPLTQDVTVRWMLTDGTVLTEQTVTLTEGVPQTFQRLALDGYEPDANTPESITVTLAGDGSINPATPVFYYHVKEVALLTQDVTVRWMLTDGTVLTEQTVTLTEGVPQTFQRLTLDGYEPDANTPESITVTLAGDGSINPGMPVFYYHVKEVAPLTQDVTVRWMLTDGTVLTEQTVTLTEGVPQTFQRLALDGYEPDADTPESITVTLAGDGSINPGMPVFYYHVKEIAPLTQNVTVRWMLTDGTVLTEQTVTLTEGVPQTFQRLALDGYEPDADTPESITVTLAGDGSINPGMPVFYYHVKEAAKLTRDVTVRWMLTDGTVLTEQTVTLTEGVPQSFDRLTLDGYEPEGMTPETITAVLSADGTVIPDPIVFYYHAAIQPPKTAEVTVTYVADQSTVLRTETVTVSEAAPHTFSRLAFEGYEPDADTPESITVTVASDGSVSPQGAVFSYHTYVKPTDVPPVTVPVHYVDAGGNPLAPDQYVTVDAGRSIQLAPDSSLVPGQYDPASAGTITIQVSPDGIASPDEATFVFKHREAEETPIPVGEYINRWAQTTAKGVNIRSTPAKKGNAVKIAKTGTKVYAVQSVLNAQGQNWIKVIYEGKEGYISSEFLEILSQAQSDDYQDTLSTTVPAVTPEYIEPTQAAPTDAPATEPPATELPATATPTVPPTATPVPETYTGYALTQAVVALRDEVSNSDSSIMTKLEKNALVTVKGQVYTESGEAWSQVQTLENLIGFVPDATLRRINAQEADYYIREYQEAHPTPTPKSTATEAPIQITGYAYTIGDNVPFRNTYSDKSVILSQLTQKTAVYVAGQEYNTEDGWPWHMVMYNGTLGYIRSDMLRMMSASETEQYLAGPATAAPTAQITAKPYDPDSSSSYGYIYASNNGAVNMRKTASTKANVVKRLRNYAFCLVLGTQKIDGTTWYRITYDGVTGYVQGSFFKQMSLAELEEFIHSPEYQQGIVNNTSTDPSATAAPIVSQEEQNVNTWTDPNSGLNVTYATWAPFATTAPIITSAPVNTPTPSPTPEGVVVIAVSPSVSPSLAPTAEPIPTVEVEPVEPTRGSSAWVWISLVCLAAGGAGYVMVIRKRNQKRAAERARQRKAQIARQQSTAPAAEKPKTGTYPQQPGQASVRRPYTEVPAPRPTQPQPRNGANAAGQNGYKPVFQENTQPQAKPVNPYEKPTEPMINKENANAAPVSDTPDVSSTSNGEGTQRTGRRARRRAMEALNENQSNKPEI